MRARAVAVRLLVRADGELGDMALGIVVSHLQHRVDATGAALLPPVEQHVRRVGDEVGFPDPPVEEFSFAAEIVFFAGVARREHMIIIKNEIVVAKQAHHRRRVGHGDVTRRLCAATVEVLVPGVERDGK